MVYHAIASYAAAPWVTSVTVHDALPILSDYCLLMLSLALPALPATSATALPTLYAHWEPGTQVH